MLGFCHNFSSPEAHFTISVPQEPIRHMDGLMQERHNSSALAMELMSFLHLPIDMEYVLITDFFSQSMIIVI